MKRYHNRHRWSKVSEKDYFELDLGPC